MTPISSCPISLYTSDDYFPELPFQNRDYEDRIEGEFRLVKDENNSISCEALLNVVDSITCNVVKILFTPTDPISPRSVNRLVILHDVLTPQQVFERVVQGRDIRNCYLELTVDPVTTSTVLRIHFTGQREMSSCSILFENYPTDFPEERFQEINHEIPISGTFTLVRRENGKKGFLASLRALNLNDYSQPMNFITPRLRMPIAANHRSSNFYEENCIVISDPSLTLEEVFDRVNGNTAHLELVIDPGTLSTILRVDVGVPSAINQG